MRLIHSSKMVTNLPWFNAAGGEWKTKNCGKMRCNRTYSTVLGPRSHSRRLCKSPFLTLARYYLGTTEPTSPDPYAGPQIWRAAHYERQTRVAIAHCGRCSKHRFDEENGKRLAAPHWRPFVLVLQPFPRLLTLSSACNKLKETLKLMTLMH
jgi:hypothetical protein